MDILINDKNIIEYEIIKNKENFQVPFTPKNPEIFFQQNKYTFIQIKNITEGLMIDSAKSNETEVYLFDKTDDSANSLIAVKNTDKNVALSFTFIEGYRIKIYDEAKKESQIFFYQPNTFVQIKNKGIYQDYIVKDFVIDGKNSFKYSSNIISTTREGNIEYKQKEFVFNMPKHNVNILIEYYPHNKDDFAYIKIDLNCIKKYSYSHNRSNGYNTNFDNFITTATYSDDYDAGLLDKVIDEKQTYIFGKNCNIRIKLNLLEKLNLKILLNKKEVKSTLGVTKNNVQTFTFDDKEIIDEVYEYDFNFIELNESGIINFEIIE